MVMAAAQVLQPEAAGKYHFSSLAGDRFSFRLLQLLPGRRGSSIRIKIDKFIFAQDAHPPYEALSYTWGDPKDKVAIIVSDGHLAWSLSVTRNCEEALRYLRFERRPRWLWIDAICINQRNTLEKHDQVFNMINIYRVAREVVAWLGPADATTHIAFDWMRTVNQNVTFSGWRDRLVMVCGGNNRYLISGGAAIIDSEQRTALRILLQKSWFTRLWIWQEMSCRTEKSTLKCGGHVISWQKFVTSIEYCAGKENVHVPNRLFGLLLGLSRAMYGRGLFDLMDDMRNADCCDPRDRIYVAEALTLAHHSRVRPTYSRKWKSVYTTWAKQRTWESLDFLQFAGKSHVRSCLPSWVPDWSHRDRPQRLGHGYPSGSAGASSHVDETGGLTVFDKTVCEIRATVPFGSDSRDLYDDTLVKSKIASFLRHLIRLGYAGRGENRLANLINALTAGHVAERYVPRHPKCTASYRLAAKSKEFMAETEPHTGNFSQCASELYSMFGYHHWYARAFFTTKNGHYGLCPACSEDGDKVVAVLGCSLPLILRKHEGGKYQLIGAAFCDGIMFGEAILGPLPDKIECVKYCVEAASFMAFKDLRRKGLSYTDPRLPPLPAEWEVVTSKDTPYFPEYKHAKTGELRNALCDPRCDIIVLRARGVRIESFTLV